MDLEVDPQPTDEERAAIEAALGQMVPRDDEVVARGAWWAAGVAENVDAGD